MKKTRGRILRKLKSISWRPGLVFQSNTPVQVFQTSSVAGECKNPSMATSIDENLVISEAVRDAKEEDLASGPNADAEANLVLTNVDKVVVSSETKLEIIDKVSTHDHAEVSAVTDPALETATTAKEDQVNQETDQGDNKKILPLISDFEDKCPPGGSEIVVLYTTSLTGIRKTYEECNTVRFLLESFRVQYCEKDVSMHLEYREELWRVLGGRAVPPRLFIRGRYIGGADEVVRLHEDGVLKTLLHGIPSTPSNSPCSECAGKRFVLCSTCNGSRKVIQEGEKDGQSTRCPDCNENGLVKCSACNV